MSCVPNTRFDRILILLSVKSSESQFTCTEHELIINLPLLCTTLVEIMVYFRTHLDFFSC